MPGYYYVGDLWVEETPHIMRMFLSRTYNARMLEVMVYEPLVTSLSSIIKVQLENNWFKFLL